MIFLSRSDASFSSSSNSELTLASVFGAAISVRKTIGVKRVRTLRSKHLELYNMVQSRGGPPKTKGSVAFWKAVTEEWNEKNPNDKYVGMQAWKGTKRAYDLIIKKLGLGSMSFDISAYMKWLEGGKRR